MMIINPILEHFTDAVDSRNQCIYFFFCIVQGERCAHGTLYTKTYHQWLGTMVTRTDGYAETVKKCTHIEMMYILDQEGDDGIFVLCFSEYPHSIDFAHLLHTISSQFLFVGDNIVHT